MSGAARPLIAEVTGRRAMPPWLPVPGYGTFAGERRLSDSDIEILRRWHEQGAPRGRPGPSPSAADVSRWLAVRTARSRRDAWAAVSAESRRPRGVAQLRDAGTGVRHDVCARRRTSAGQPSSRPPRHHGSRSDAVVRASRRPGCGARLRGHGPGGRATARRPPGGVDARHGACSRSRGIGLAARTRRRPRAAASYDPVGEA